MRRAAPWVGLLTGITLLGVAVPHLAAPTPSGIPEPPPAEQSDQGRGDRQPSADEADDVAPEAASESAPALSPLPSEAAGDQPSARETPPGDVASAASPVERLPARPASVGDLQERSVPMAVDADDVGLSADVEPVGLGPDGAMALPDASRAGWFRHGPAHGEASGSTVIAGHVDSHDGPGAFLPAWDLREGDHVTVSGSEGDTVEYEVAEVTVHRKLELPTSDLFDASGPHRLVLITCGGEFDEDARSYTENLVVIAEPLH